MEISVLPLREPLTPWNPGVVPDDLRGAVEAVAIALDELRTDPGSPAGIGTVGQAAAAVMVLQPNLTREALQQLVVVIDDCHQSGSPNSEQLDAAWRAAATALQTDIRWM
jgi:hypothetical protein